MVDSHLIVIFLQALDAYPPSQNAHDSHSPAVPTEVVITVYPHSIHRWNLVITDTTLGGERAVLNKMSSKWSLIIILSDNYRVETLASLNTGPTIVGMYVSAT